MITIEIANLPRTALIDTGVFIRFLGERPDDHRAPICKAFCAAMLENGKELFVAAPTITEATRHKAQRIPRRAGITVVPFDYLAAEQLGIDGPETLITELSKATGTSKNYIKYDYMIAACAIRARASVLVAYDSDYRKICESLKLAFKQPTEFLDRESSAAWHKAADERAALKALQLDSGAPPR